MNAFKNKIAVITGGGRGFGKAFGVALAEAGAHVVLVDIDGAEAEAAAAQIRAAGHQATGCAGDVTSEVLAALHMSHELAGAIEDQGG